MRVALLAIAWLLAGCHQEPPASRYTTLNFDGYVVIDDRNFHFKEGTRVYRYDEPVPKPMPVMPVRVPMEDLNLLPAESYEEAIPACVPPPMPPKEWWQEAMPAATNEVPSIYSPPRGYRRPTIRHDRTPTIMGAPPPPA